MDPTYRIVIIGNAYVGKTSLVTRCIHKQFTNSYEGTIGASFFTYNAKIPQSLFKNAEPQGFLASRYVTVPFQLWDTAGTEKYRSLAPIYYKNASAAIFVYDISDRSSFDDLDQWVSAFKDSCTNIISANDVNSDVNMSGWDSEASLTAASNNNEICGVPLYLVANKNDLADRIVVPNEEGEKWAKEHHFKFISTSAVTGDNVELLFSTVANDVIAMRNQSTESPNEIKALDDTEFDCC